jgi:heme-degrading monooxygenase HmoA
MNPNDVDQFVKVWVSTVEAVKKQGGFISAQLHRGVAGSSVFVAYVVFESAKNFDRVFNSPEFKFKLSDYPHSVVISPHMFKKVAVPGICVD